MLDYITVGRGVITEAIYPEVVAMVSHRVRDGRSGVKEKITDTHVVFDLLVLVQLVPFDPAPGQPNRRCFRSGRG
jgi:hypothetical protein